MPPGVRESMLGYHSCDMRVLTCSRESGWGTVSGGQFDWGGRLRKSNGGVQRLAQHGQKSCIQSANAKASLTARQTSRAGTKVGVSDPAVESGIAVAQRIKATLGITG